MIQLRGGFTTLDPRLDRVPFWDKRNENYPIREALARDQRRPRSYTWRCYTNLDQGREGACVGFAWAHELAARPVVVLDINDRYARDIYYEAQRIDEWPGENYSGTSVLAGAKVVQTRQLIGEYRWALNIEDLILAVGYKGPAVLGINWYEEMYAPNDSGYIVPAGRVVGGHAIMAYSVSVAKRRFSLWNSWGSDWGRGGSAYLSFDDADRLIFHEHGEACIPVLRRK